jgi:hypothetical protein
MYIGVTPSVRPAMWRLALGLSASGVEEEESAHVKLSEDCDKYDFITDDLFLNDVSNVVDDPRSVFALFCYPFLVIYLFYF